MIKDVIFISRGNGTFRQLHVRRLGWRLACLSAGCFLLPSAGSGAFFKAQAPQLTQSVISWWNFFKGMEWNWAKNNYQGSEQEGLCVLVSTLSVQFQNKKKTPWMPPPRAIAAVTRPLGRPWWEDVDKGKTEGWQEKLWGVREIIATAVIAPLKCNLLWSLWNGR